MRIDRLILRAPRLSLAKNFLRKISSENNFVKNVVGLSSQTATRDFKNKPMLILEDSQAVSYDQMNILSGRIAASLNAKYGINKGDFVLCRTSKTVEAVAIYFAVLRLGAIYIPLNPSYTPRETKHFVNDSKPKLFITMDLKGDSYFSDMVPRIQDEVIIAHESLKMEPTLDVERVAEGDMATMLYTSGTTGTPKGAMISHGALTANAESSAEHWRFTSDDVQLHTLPFYHIHGMFISFNCSLLTKSSSIFLPKFSVPEVIKWLPKSTVFMGVPSYYHRLLESPDFGSNLLSNFRLFVCGSAPLSPATFSEFRKRAHMSILERYGMTEALVVTSNPYEEELRVSGAVGQPIANVKVRISDEGLIEVKSPALFNGYWKLPEKTKNEFTVDGYFITGDMGEFDDKGNLQILGRQKELIISGGLNVYPKEVEEILDSTGQVKESAIIGVPHPDYGEAVVAVCVLTPENKHHSENDESHEKVSKTLRKLLRAELAGYKIPKQFIFVDELPRNFLGKLQKHVLKEKHKDLFSKLAASSEGV